MIENVEENGDVKIYSKLSLMHLVMSDDIFLQRCRGVLNMVRLIFS